ncbi:MAG: DUF523 domain-containing protein [Pseudomonadota bacterium]
MHHMEFVVSACLAGVACRYDGKDNAHDAIMNLVAQGRAILVCPEQLGGMATPRIASEIQCQAYKHSGTDMAHHVGEVAADRHDRHDRHDGHNGHDGHAKLVLQADGTDVSEAFALGAREALRIAKLAGCTKAVVKARSPSCGCGLVYDGTFSKKLISGNGLFAQALLDDGFTVWTEENFLTESSSSGNFLAENSPTPTK